VKKNYDGAEDYKRESVNNVLCALVRHNDRFLSALQIRHKIRQTLGYSYETCTIKKAIGILRYHGYQIKKVRFRVPRSTAATFVKYRLA